jgi:hypothetical protein
LRLGQHPGIDQRREQSLTRDLIGTKAQLSAAQRQRECWRFEKFALHPLDKGSNRVAIRNHRVILQALCIDVLCGEQATCRIRLLPHFNYRLYR